MRLNIKLNLNSERVQLHLLEGLDSWVKLGLLSEAQVRELARSMSQPIPSVEDAPASLPSFVNRAAASSSAVDSLTEGATESPTEALPRAEPKISKLLRALRPLLEEISVIWLLFLGVFLVVVSSGLLAASQWQSFSAVGQYAILLAYTLAFWGASIWAQRQEQLQVTAKMLALTATLLIPINFWMMDAIGLRNTPVGVGVGGLSALLLSCLLLKLLADRSNQINVIALSWLHLGWIAGGWAFWPVAATYVGTVGTAASLTYQDRQSALPSDLPAEESEGTEGTEAVATRSPAFDLLAVSLSVLLLLFRSLFVVQVPPHQLGLAAGICGWLLVWLNRNQQSRELWQWVGVGLLFAGWAVTVEQQPPLQAIAISTLALWLLWDRLKLSWQKGYLLALIGTAGQAYWLLSAVIPPKTRDTILTQLAQRLSTQPVSKVEWMSLGLFPFLWGLLWFARQLRRWRQPALSQLTEGVALAVGLGMTAFSSGTRFTLAAHLLLSAITLFAIVRRRPRIQGFMVTLAHVFGLGAIAACIHYLQPELAVFTWAYILLAGGLAEFALHLTLRSDGEAFPGENRWRQNTWGMGLCLFALSYAALIEGWSFRPDWIWLVVPIALTFVANHRRALHPVWLAKVTLLAAVLQTPWLAGWGVAIASFAIGTLCMLLNSRIWQSRWAALFTVGSGIACVTSMACYSIDALNINEDYLWIVWALEIAALGLMARALAHPTGKLSGLYRRASNLWELLLMTVLLLLGTAIAASVIDDPLYQSFLSASSTRYLLVANVLLIATLLEAIRHQPADWRYWRLAWATEIVAVLGLVLCGVGVEGVAVATLALGFGAQIGADVWVLRRPPYRSSWQGIPIVYALLGALLGHATFGANSGLFTIGAGAIAIGVGRRKASLHPLSYTGLAALSLGAYELLVYRMLQASGGQAGDGFTLLAILALIIALVERFLSPWLLRYLLIPAQGLRGVAHAHWLLGSVLAVAAAVTGLSQPKGITLWTGTSVLLAGYALITGNRRWTPQTFVSNPAIWTSVGIVEILLCAAHNRFVWFSDRTFLITWGGLAACAVSFAVYQLPWERWGWPLRPWRLLALWLPLSALGVAVSYRVPTQSLLIVGAFYAWMAKQRDQVRLSYLSVLLFDWALLRYLDEQGWLTALAFSLVAGVSLLYVAEIEPYFQGLSADLSPNLYKRQQRHWLRSLASGLIGITALYQAESDHPLLLYVAITLALGTGLILAGLALKVRAFLYVGTGTFVLQIIRVLWLFINDNSLLLWAVGIVLGLSFIWVAATFESRRGQVSHRLESWNTALQTWD